MEETVKTVDGESCSIVAEFADAEHVEADDCEVDQGQGKEVKAKKVELEGRSDVDKDQDVNGSSDACDIKIVGERSDQNI
jgi:hypothetical protein